MIPIREAFQNHVELPVLQAMVEYDNCLESGQCTGDRAHCVDMLSYMDDDMFCIYLDASGAMETINIINVAK